MPRPPFAPPFPINPTNAAARLVNHIHACYQWYDKDIDPEQQVQVSFTGPQGERLSVVTFIYLNESLLLIEAMDSDERRSLVTLPVSPLQFTFEVVAKQPGTVRKQIGFQTSAQVSAS